MDNMIILACSCLFLLPNEKVKHQLLSFRLPGAFCAGLIFDAEHLLDQVAFGVCFTPLSMHRLYCWPFSKRHYNLNADCFTVYTDGLNGALNKSYLPTNIDLKWKGVNLWPFLKKLYQVSVFVKYLRIGSGLWNTSWNNRSDLIHIIPWMTSMFACFSRVFFQVGFSDSTAVNERVSLNWHWIAWLSAQP